MRSMLLRKAFDGGTMLPKGAAMNAGQSLGLSGTES